MTLIHISEIKSEDHRWIHTWDGYRELAKYGNRHAKFVDSEWLQIHIDQHNATNFPIGTINHLAKWGNEKTAINEDILRILGWGALAVIGIKVLQKI